MLMTRDKHYPNLIDRSDPAPGQATAIAGKKLHLQKKKYCVQSDTGIAF